MNFKARILVCAIGWCDKHKIKDMDIIGEAKSMNKLLALCFEAQNKYGLTAVSLHGGHPKSIKSVSGIYSLRGHDIRQEVTDNLRRMDI